MLDLTVIVPTKGRATLARTLASIPDGVRTLILADGAEATALARKLAKGRWHTEVVWSLLKKPSGELGHPQRNAGMAMAQTKWLAFMDDDDTYTPDAFDVLAAHLNGNRVPHIFQMRYGKHPHAPPGFVLWQAPIVQFGNVGTPMFIVPNDPAKLGVWPSRVGGDFFFIAETCVKMGDPVWVPEVIAEVRP